MVFLNESHIHAGLDVSAFRFHPIKVGKDSLFLSKKHKKEDLSAFRSQHIKVVRLNYSHKFYLMKIGKPLK